MIIGANQLSQITDRETNQPTTQSFWGWNYGNSNCFLVDRCCRLGEWGKTIIIAPFLVQSRAFIVIWCRRWCEVGIGSLPGVPRNFPITSQRGNLISYFRWSKLARISFVMFNTVDYICPYTWVITTTYLGKYPYTHDKLAANKFDVSNTQSSITRRMHRTSGDATT